MHSCFFSKGVFRDALKPYITDFHILALAGDFKLRVETKKRVESHLVNFEAFISDDFDTYFIDRAKSITKIIEFAMGKTISDKG